jgi:Leucine-rich repeat (LRR) protein
LSNLELLDLSNNQLQGTFNHLMKCKNLTYINLSNNIISEPTKLAPLKRIGNITICINDNPLCFTDGYANKIKNYNIKITKSPKKIL